MAIQYKVDLLAALKAAGYSSYRLRKEKLLGEATIQRIRQGEPVSWENISTICKLMACQTGDFLEYVPDKQNPAGDFVLLGGPFCVLPRRVVYSSRPHSSSARSAHWSRGMAGGSVASMSMIAAAREVIFSTHRTVPSL